jgi:hypothetical protein
VKSTELITLQGSSLSNLWQCSPHSIYQGQFFAQCLCAGILWLSYDEAVLVELFLRLPLAAFGAAEAQRVPGGSHDAAAWVSAACF